MTNVFHEYETIYIARPDLPENALTRLSDKFRNIIEQRNGFLIRQEDWGTQKLAYPIRKHRQGHYIYMKYVATPDVPGEVERNIRIEDDLIRFLTVRLAENVDPEARRTSIGKEEPARSTVDVDDELDDEDMSDDSE